MFDAGIERQKDWTTEGLDIPR